jgi:hypothetical protein
MAKSVLYTYVPISLASQLCRIIRLSYYLCLLTSKKIIKSEERKRFPCGIGPFKREKTNEYMV